MRIQAAVCPSSASWRETSTKPARSQARTAPSFHAYGSTVTRVATALVEQVPRHRAGRIRAETAAARRRDEEQVQPFRMNLEVTGRDARLFDDPRLDVRPRQPLLHLGACERLAVPVAGHLGVRVPRDEAVDVAPACRA